MIEHFKNEEKKMKRRNEDWGYLITGIFWIIVGILLIFYNQIFISKLTNWIGTIVIVLGFLKGAKTFLPSQKLNGIKSRFLNLINSGLELSIGTWIIGFSQSTPIWLSKGIGFYQLIIAAITLFNYYLLKKDRVPKRLHHLLIGLVTLFWGFGSFFSSEDVENTLIRLGIYLIFIGLTSINDARDLIVTEHEKNKIKRRIRIGVPVIFTMLIPANILSQINQFLKDELDISPEQIKSAKSIHSEGNPILKVFIHVSESGTGAMGHVDLSYKGIIYAYGNYDVDSERLFGSVGDGCFFSLEETNYINYCLEEGKTLFEYTVLLNKQQQRAFEMKLQEFKNIMIPWKLETQSQKESYIGKMSSLYEVETYKFTKSRFKTYFVLGTNCVLLADHLIGTSGLDLIAMVGILSPGTYYDYFNQEYKKPHSIVIDSKVHHAGMREKYQI